MANLLTLRCGGISCRVWTCSHFTEIPITRCGVLRKGNALHTCAKKRMYKKLRKEKIRQIDVASEDQDLERDDVDSMEVAILTNKIADARKKIVSSPSRRDVLQACTITSGIIAALGICIRQISHVASAEGFPILDCSSLVSFNVEAWHTELIAGSVVLISSCRYLLLQTWPDFANSSEAANRQALSPLEPQDYLVVSFLPGIGEELLFRGALQPLFGMKWQSVLAVAVLFGVLHIGGGRKSSFALWATFVGAVYGFTTLLCSSVAVPMISHSVNNLVGGFIWRATSNKQDSDKDSV